MRKLNTSDMFKAARLLIQLEMKDDILEITEKADSFKNVNDLGYEFIFRMFSKAVSEESEKSIYEFLSGPFEVDSEEIRDMELDKLFSTMKEVLPMSQCSAFFKRAVSLTS